MPSYFDVMRGLLGQGLGTGPTATGGGYAGQPLLGDWPSYDPWYNDQATSQFPPGWGDPATWRPPPSQSRPQVNMPDWYQPPDAPTPAELLPQGIVDWYNQMPEYQRSPGMFDLNQWFPPQPLMDPLRQAPFGIGPWFQFWDRFNNSDLNPR